MYIQKDKILGTYISGISPDAGHFDDGCTVSAFVLIIVIVVITVIEVKQMTYI